MNVEKRLTFLSYFIFALLGITCVSQGILIIYYSAAYKLTLAQVGYCFFITAVVQAIVTFSNGYILEKVNIKKEVFIGLGAIFISLILLISGVFTLYLISLFVLGIGYGLLLSVPNYLIITIHSNNKFQKLNILNFAYSFGGIIGPLCLGKLLGMSVPWQLAVLICNILIVLLFVYVLKIPFGIIKMNSENEDTSLIKKEAGHWHISIYLIAGAILFYVLSEYTFSTWIVSYLKLKYHYPIFYSSLGLTIFWLFITFGRFASDKIGRYMKVYKFILISSSVGFAAYILLFLTSNISFIFAMIAIMGVGYAGLYASILSYGVDQRAYNDPKLMSFLVLAGTIGSILALPMSSFLVHHISIRAALIGGAVIMGLVILTITLSLYDKSNLAVTYKKIRIWGAISNITCLTFVKKILEKSVQKRF